jgi:integrase
VTIALNTGMRKNEILKLTWDRVDFSRGVLQLAEMKNGRRREVPMNRAVYDVLSNLPARGRRARSSAGKTVRPGVTSGPRSSTPAGARRSPTSASTTSDTPAPRG